ncbi:MAG: S41 family peptidase [Candidatus Saccharibacteria bacterium]|nr:S41 family peptidase [Candidatus Saccharibacteria bacterium]
MNEEMNTQKRVGSESGQKSKGLKKVALFGVAGLLIFVLGIGAGFVGREELRRSIQQGSVERDELPEDLSYDEVETVYDSLRTNFDGELSEDELLEGLKNGLVKASGDPYTEYLDEEEATSFEEGLSGSFTGIGAELGKDEQSIVIVAPLSGFPAEKAGLQPRDVIAEINGENAYDISISEAVDKIRGEKGTTVELTIIRGETERIEVEITRDEITIPSVEYEVREDNIGYIKISRFGTDTTGLVNDAATELMNQDVESIIVDVRGNPGGLMDASVAVASLWVDSGEVIVDQRRSDESVETERVSGNSVFGDIPTVVLINEGSASASEILAGALHDHGKATLIGEKTYGKGSVQRLIEFGDGSELKVTVARWFTPNGRNIDEEGIEPDQKVERTIEDFEADRDPQLDAALKELKN